MAVIDLERRAQIGREKRARTRERLLAAAAEVFAYSDRDNISIDEIAAAAGVAKGTFYIHFEDADALWSELADRLAREYDELLQPRRLALSDPFERIAHGCAAFLEKSRRNPAWAAIAARAALKRPDFGAAARARLLEDIRSAFAAAPVAGLTAELAAEIVVGVVSRAGPSLAGKRSAAASLEAVVAAILRVAGLKSARAGQMAAVAAERARADVAAYESQSPASQAEQ